MNEKIKELLDKAEVYYNDDMYSDYNDLASLQKFAELIVRECIQTIQMGITRDGHDTEKYLRSMKHIKQIKEHFGLNHYTQEDLDEAHKRGVELAKKLRVE